MTPFRHPLERAFDLAKTGVHDKVRDIKKAMRQEGYTLSDLRYLDGRTVAQDLLRARDQARQPAQAAP